METASIAKDVIRRSHVDQHGTVAGCHDLLDDRTHQHCPGPEQRVERPGNASDVAQVADVRNGDHRHAREEPPDQTVDVRAELAARRPAESVVRTDREHDQVGLDGEGFFDPPGHVRHSGTAHRQ